MRCAHGIWPGIAGKLLTLLVMVTGFGAGIALAAEYSDGWGPAVGSKLPVLEAYDQDGRLRTLENLTGERGLLLFMSRSADW